MRRAGKTKSFNSGSEARKRATIKIKMKSANWQYYNVRHHNRAARLVQTLKLLGLGLFVFWRKLFSFRRSLLIAHCSLLIGAALAGPMLYTRAGGDARVSAAVPATLNFQARLLTDGGSIVPDNNYSVVFNLYTVSSGGTSAWSETHPTVVVKSGYLSVYLGSIDNDLDTLDWSQQYWLTMNVNGDGEMNPRLQLTSVPYAFRAGQADGITDGASILEANEIVQLAPSSIQAVNTALAALRINQQGAGLLAQFQGAGSDVFTIANNGDVQSDGDATFAGGALNLGDATQVGGLVLSDGSSQTGTLQTAALGTNRTYTLPDADGTVCLTTTCATVANGFVNNGNDFGGNAVLGTNGAGQTLSLETAGVTRLTLDASGNANLTGTFTAGTGFVVSAGGFSVAGNSTLTGTLSGLTGLTVVSGGANISGGLNNNTGGITNTGSITEVGTNVTASGALTIASTGGGNALTLTSGSGMLILGSNTLQNASAALTLDVNNSGLSTFNIVNNNGSNLANLDVEGGIFAGNGNAFSVNSDGDITSAFTALDGTSTANGGSGAGTSTALILNSAANFDVGNYVQMNSANCGGTGINPCYAKITAKGGPGNNTLTITPALRWTTGSTVNEYHIPEIGGSDLTQPLANRYGRGYFISGIATGNGTTFYNEDGITTDLMSFDLLNTNVTTLNIGGAATTLNLGASGGILNIAGGISTTSGSFTSAGGIISLNENSNFATNINTGSTTGTVNIGGGSAPLVINSTNFDVSSAGALSGITTLNTSGAITAATTSNTINGIVINSGVLTSVTGITFSSGSLNLANGGIANTGSITGATSISASGAITAATSTNTINGLVVNAGALSSVASITGSSALTIASGGSSTLTLDSASNILTIADTDTGLERSASGSYTIDLKDNATTSLVLSNTSLGGSSFANLNLADGAIEIAGTTVIGSDRSLQNITTIGASGLATITGGASISGAAINLNLSSNFATTINNGTSTGAVTIGSGSNTFLLNSTAFDVSTAGALSGVTEFAQASGNFAISGAGTLSTGTGTVSLNGATSVTGTNTFTVGTGLSSLGGALTVTGLTTLNGGLTIQTGDTFTFNADAITDLSGNGLSVTTNALTISLQTGSGMTVSASGLTNRRDCANNQILKWANGGSGAWNCAADGVSDERLKKNIETLEEDMLSRIAQVRIVEFDFDCTNPAFLTMHCDTDHQTGVIAQELAQIFPELVREVNGFYQVNYDALSVYNLKAVGELSEKVNTLEAKPMGETDNVVTGGALRLDTIGVLQNITGFQMLSGGASVVGGINNNNGGITEVGAIAGATTIDAQKLILSSAGIENVLELKKDGEGVFTVFHNGALELKLDADNTFAVKKANGEDVFSINTNGGLVQIGSGTADENTILLVLDSKSTEGDPAGVNGAQYYNSASGKFRCYQNDKWQDCLPAANTEYVLSAQIHQWTQFAGESELTGKPRSWVDLTTAREFRLLTSVTSPGAQGTICRLQYTLDEASNAWTNLAWTGDNGVLIDVSGSVKGDWIRVSPGAQAEVLVRVVCRSATISTGSPVLNGLRIQVR